MNRRRKFKVHYRLCRNRNVLVAGKGCDPGACPCACQSTYQQTHAARGHATNQHSKSRATADEGRAALTFALLCASDTAGVDPVVLAIYVKSSECQLQHRRAFEVAAFVCLNDHPLCC